MKRSFAMEFSLVKHFRPLIDFYDFYAYRHKKNLFLLFLGAVVSGLLEIMGLLLLYYLLRLLVSSDSLPESHWLIVTLNALGVKNQFSGIVLLGSMIVFIFVLKNLYVISYYFAQHVTLRRWKNDISLMLMEGYLRAPYVQLLAYNSSTLKNNINSIVNSALNGYVLSSLNLFANIIIAIFISGILLVKYFTITAVVGVILVIATMLQNYFMRKASLRLGQERDRLAADQDRQVYQGFVALKETKVGGKEFYFVQAFKEINSKAIAVESKITFLGRLSPHLMEIVMIFAIVVMCLTIYQTRDGDAGDALSSLGVLAAISFRIGQVLNRVTAAVHGMNTNTSAMVKTFQELRKLRVIKNKSRKVHDKASINLKEREPFSLVDNIAFKNVSFQYPNSSEFALKDISFTIKKGEFIGIVGKSGSGKTTMVDLLSGLLPVTDGELLIDGTLITEDNVREWQRSIGYVPQDIHLNEDTIAANVAFGEKKENIDYEKVKASIAKVLLDEKIDTLEHGINTDVGEYAKFFSGGEKQRIAIARALYRGADLMLLDEATSALDTPTEDVITRSINQLKGEKTLVVIAHRLSTLKLADRIIFMNKGVVVGFETFKNLYAENKEFRNMVDLSNIHDIL